MNITFRVPTRFIENSTIMSSTVFILFLETFFVLFAILVIHCHDPGGGERVEKWLQITL